VKEASGVSPSESGFRRRGLSRGEFLKLGGAAFAGLALVGSAAPALAQTTATPAPDLGISKNNAPAENRANLVKALSGSSASVHFPAGDYLVDNSDSYIVITGFSGTLTMEAGARFVFTDNTKRGLNFLRGSGAVFEGLTSAFRVRPPSRVGSEECIFFSEATDVTVRRADIDGSAAAGLLFGRCIRPSVDGAKIRNTRADGLHFANCQDARANNVLVENSGDDGVAFLNYAGGPDNHGGLATNVTVKGSQSRGIAVVGQRNVTVRGFYVEGTASSGLYCAQEASYNTRTPSNVIFESGAVYYAGRVNATRPNRNGITFSNVASVTFNDITVGAPFARGVSGTAPGGVVSINRVVVRNVPQSGFDMTGGIYRLHNLTAESTGQAGIYVGRSASLTYGTLIARNTATADRLGRAFSFEHNTRVSGSQLFVVDSKRIPTGYKVNAYGTRNQRLGTIYDRVNRRAVKLENVAARLSYRLA